MVVGAAFIGMELVENLYGRGIIITIVELAEQVLALLDREMFFIFNLFTFTSLTSKI
jgi:pyruvate/2-oxoglutarate dehydrogenase complex dihydrolipoamide dehydrogenase (E3) component